MARKLSVGRIQGAPSPGGASLGSSRSPGHTLTSLAGAPLPAGATRKARPPATVSQTHWMRRKKRARVMRTLGEWEECKDRRTGAVFYFNSRTRTGVETLEDVGDPTVIAAAQRNRGLAPQDWKADETLGLAGQSFRGVSSGCGWVPAICCA